jgi:uncharacterized membrane protein (DUF4010 family)
VPFTLTTLGHLVVALLGGLAVGIEREWSGKAVGPRARFAGMRTFTLLGLVAGFGGWLWTAGLAGPATVLVAGPSALIVIAYYAASRKDVDGTTEVAAFVVLTAGVLAGSGYDRVSSAVIAVTVLLLVEKKRLHGFVSKLDRTELRAGARFAVMAAVILPLLPVGPYGPWGGVRPRSLWAIVLFFSGLSFTGYIARRAFGNSRGFVIGGLLGGVVSSTSVTLQFARESRTNPALGQPLAAGALAANMVLFPRVLFASAVLAPAMALAAWPRFVAPAAIGAILAWREIGRGSRSERTRGDGNPLEFFQALQMAVFFQVVLFGVWFASSSFGQPGLYASAALLGLVEVDALTASLATVVAAGTPPETAAWALTVGILSNTILKLAIAAGLGRGRFRFLAGAGLALMAIALAAGIAWR